eukprot:GILJ01002150.1.p1 GENE.GILJ01002150.1~~GILJ01002150.1.p1  ORF type:complete len:709 (-),score=129.47 GILJ01002150.1:82-1896(-)
MADEAIRIGPVLSKDSYLRMDVILQACKDSGAEAVHPGYGFLSENRHFQKMLQDNGIVFIGPSTHAIEAMGDKIESKKLAKAAGVNTVPGYLGEVHDDAEVLKIAREIGYPVMIKASAGGGGKGMRIAWNDDEAKLGFRLSRDEAKASFGDDRIFIEKFIEEPRHIEFQILGDLHGNVVYLPERDCSIQRRNQKVIEEAPSTSLDEKTRRAMGEQAVALAKAVDYHTTGTVEFLVDKKKGFYFLEMNTRLQVEHPITEMITGLDLVEQMIRVAAGHKLQFRQEDIKIDGWAMETRVYAEDPLRGFLPSIGFLTSYQEPPMKEGLRIDTGVSDGTEISMYYDPMICKLITHGKTRKEAIAMMTSALDNYVIRGVGHNAAFCRAVYTNPTFVEGRLSTKFIPEQFPQGFKGVQLTDDKKKLLAAIVGACHIQQTMFVTRTSSCVIRLDGSAYTVDMHNDGVTVDGQNYALDQAEDVSQHFVFAGTVNGQEVAVQQLKKNALGYDVQFEGAQLTVECLTQQQADLIKYMPAKQTINVAKVLQSPMPGAVVSVAVKAGDEVVIGQELAVVEAMKMQNVLRASANGKVKKVTVKPGSTVAVDEILVEFE